MFSPKVSKIKLENFGGCSYVALKDNEEIKYDSCVISEKTETPLAGSKMMDIDNLNNSLSDDYVTKFFVVSISTLGLYVFYRLLSK